MRLLGYLVAICAGIAIALAAQTWYLKSQVLGESAFAHRATQVATEPSVRETIASEVTDVVVRKTGVSAEKISPTVERALGSRTFNRLLATGAKSFNAALFHDARGRSLAINLGGLLNTDLIPASVLDRTRAHLVTARAKSALRDANDAAKLVRALSIVLPLLAVVALLLAVVLARRLFRTLAIAALGVAVASIGMLPLLSHLRSKTIHILRFARGLDPTHGNAFAVAIWNGFFGDMHTIAVIGLVGGAILGIAGVVLTGRPARALRSVV